MASVTVPSEVQRLWDNKAFQSSTTTLTKISIAQGAQMGSDFLTDKSFGTRTVIGVAVTIADASSKGASVSVNNTALMTYAQAALTHVTFKDGNNKEVIQDIPLLSLVPPVGKQYVPLYLENFNPGKSQIKWAADLNNSTDIYLELVLYCL